MGAAEKDEREVRDEDVSVDEPVEDEDIVFMRGPNGFVWAMGLPLPESIAHQVSTGDLVQVNEDGSPYVPSEDDRELDLESEGDRHARERAAGLEYARLKHEKPEVDPLELRDEAADTVGDVIPEDAAQVGDEDKPKAADSKAVWVHYAKSHGVSDEDANAMTKAQLVEKFS